jgi:hypothetical protein
MIRYNYNRQTLPPAPFVHVTVRHPQTEVGVDDLPAQIDTAADFTVVPSTVISQLGLAQLDQVAIGGFGGHVTLAPTFLVGLVGRGFAPLMVRVLGGEDEPFVLLGRDVLNHYRIFLDGPSLILEMNEPG